MVAAPGALMVEKTASKGTLIVSTPAYINTDVRLLTIVTEAGKRSDVG